MVEGVSLREALKLALLPTPIQIGGERHGTMTRLSLALALRVLRMLLR